MEFDLERHKALLRSMTRVFDRFCRENNLRYSLFGGSLLGAVRHRGIIPWDDDVDIMMPRPDYDKLIELASKQFPEGYKIVYAGNSPYYYLPLAKMVDTNTTLIEFKKNKRCSIGVNLDIFPIDAVPKDAQLRERNYRTFRKKYEMASVTAECDCDFLPIFQGRFRLNTTLHWLRNLAYRCLYSSSDIFNSADRLASSTAWADGEECRVYSSYQFHGRVFPKDLFEHFVDLEFDGIQAMCIRDYDTLLTACYKNYMQLPPVEKRVCHHHHYFLDYDHGYTFDELKKQHLLP
jgi:lipopolysaccharide cholinephosphotransferase